MENQERPLKAKPRAKLLPKVKETYLEAEECLFLWLEENLIGYRRKFQFESTRNWRFDFYIVKLNLLIEIAGSSWSVGCGGKKIANAFNKYDLAENMGYTFVRLEPHQIVSGYAINWIQGQFGEIRRWNRSDHFHRRIKSIEQRKKKQYA